MKIAVLGSGVVGVTTAWCLRQDGHDVTVIDQHTAPAHGCSRASGGQLAVSFAEPWANRDAPLQLLKWLFKDDAPLRFRPRADLRQWSWSLQFFRECWPGRLERNMRYMVGLSAYSLSVLRHMRAELNINYHQQKQGTLNFYRNAADLEKSQDMAGIMRGMGVDRRIVTVGEMLSIEPTLASIQDSLVGGDFTSDDESGDAWMFTRALATVCRDAGVDFLYSHQVTGLRADNGKVTCAEVLGPDGLYDTVPAEAFVIALGARSAELVQPLGIPCNVYPARGHSVTFDIVDANKAPVTNLTDQAHEVLYSRCGNQLRMAGTAELSGFSNALDQVRCASMVRQAQELFPDALDFQNVRCWSGLRPSTPSGVPLIGQTRIRNLYLNTGHGSLGWTMAAGSAKALADLVSGRSPEPEFPFLG